MCYLKQKKCKMVPVYVKINVNCFGFQFNIVKWKYIHVHSSIYRNSKQWYKEVIFIHIINAIRNIDLCARTLSMICRQLTTVSYYPSRWRCVWRATQSPVWCTGSLHCRHPYFVTPRRCLAPACSEHSRQVLYRSYSFTIV